MDVNPRGSCDVTIEIKVGERTGLLEPDSEKEKMFSSMWGVLLHFTNKVF